MDEFDDEDEEEDLEDERKRLQELGVKPTWDILGDLTKKKKEE